MSRIGFGLFAVVMWTAAVAVAQAPPGLAERWLLHRCDTGQPGVLEREVRRYAQALEPIFIAAVERGPAPKLVADARRNAQRQFRQRQGLLKTGAGLGFDPPSLELARQVRQKDFVDQAERNFVISYQSEAVAGLGITAGGPARQLLRKLAADPTSPLQSSARLALEAADHPPQPPPQVAPRVP